MIRINLVPKKLAKKKERGKEVELLVFLLVLLICGAVIWILHSTISEKIDTQTRANDGKRLKINAIQQEIKDHELIKKQLAEIEAREKIIQELVAARTGPVQMLVEMSRILAGGPDSGPSVKPDEYQEMLKRDPSSGFDPEWDARRLWITSFVEQEKRVMIAGLATSNEDVGEFLRRLKISRYFFDEVLLQTASEGEKETGASIVSFRIKCTIRYR